MSHLFLAHGSTDHEETEAVVSLSAIEMAEHVYQFATEQDLPISDIDDNPIATNFKPHAIAQIAMHLSAGRSLFVGNDGRAAELVATREPVRHSDTTPDTIDLFCRCDHLAIDDLFVGFVENEAPELTAKYQAAVLYSEKQAILNVDGDTTVFAFRSDDHDISITLREFAESELDLDQRYAYVQTKNGNYRIKFLVSFAL